MHYIRLLRPPVVETGRSHATLKLVVTITTDLGDSFLSSPSPIPLSVIGAYTEHRDGKDQLVALNLTQSQNPAPIWRSGMRVLKFDVALSRQPVKTIQIRPSSPHLTALGTSDICLGKEALIMTAYADISLPGTVAPAVCFRSLRLPVPGQAPLQVEEDIGESIARHIWDAGITTVSLIASLVLDGAAHSGQTTPSILRSVLQAKNILELGCGVGVLGIGMARILSLAQANTTASILMTDLPEAEEKTRANIARQPGSGGKASVQLDFEALDWEDARNGVFGDKVQARAWDIVVLSDCTYNVDMLPPLVKTLSALRDHSARQGEVEKSVRTEVLLATKPRHSSEKALFDLMSADGWCIREKTVLPLPVLDGEDQSVEVYLFGVEK